MFCGVVADGVVHLEPDDDAGTLLCGIVVTGIQIDTIDLPGLNLNTIEHLVANEGGVLCSKCRGVAQFRADLLTIEDS